MMRGFTLIELMLTLLILGTLLSTGIPAFSSYLQSYYSKTELNQMRQFMQASRQLALENKQKVTLCAVTSARCNKHWKGNLTIFIDKNLNQVIDDGETIFFSSPNFSKKGSWQKKKDNQAYVRFNELGHAFSSATTFLYCPNNNQLKYARQLVISFQGRIRTANYLSSRGTPYQSVSPLSCQ